MPRTSADAGRRCSFSPPIWIGSAIAVNGVDVHRIIVYSGLDHRLFRSGSSSVPVSPHRPVLVPMPGVDDPSHLPSGAALPLQ